MCFELQSRWGFVRTNGPGVEARPSWTVTLGMESVTWWGQTTAGYTVPAGSTEGDFRYWEISSSIPSYKGSESISGLNINTSNYSVDFITYLFSLEQLAQFILILLIHLVPFFFWLYPQQTISSIQVTLTHRCMSAAWHRLNEVQ